MEDSTATKQILVDLLETCRKENKRLRKEDKRIRKKERRHRKKCKHQRKEIRRLREATMHRIDKIAKQIAPENPVLSQSANDLGSNKRARITTESSDEEPPVKVAKGITAAALSKLAIDGTKTGYINEKSIATKSTGTLCSESDDGLEQTEKTESEYSEYHDNDSKNTKSDGQFRWLPSMDARLKTGVQKYKGQGWEKIAEYVGGGLTALQCRRRWNTYVSREQGCKRGDWTEQEVKLLEQLVPKHRVKPHWNKSRKVITREHTHWAAIGKELHRFPAACYRKWTTLQGAKLKLGPFTAAEDALIRQRVKAWGGQKKGLWVSMQQEMGRPAHCIQERWVRIKDA